MFQFNLILIPFIFSALVALVLAVASWRQRYRPQALYFTFFMLCILIWVVGFIFEIAATSLDVKVILANIQYIGIDAGPVSFLALTLAYTGKIKRYKNVVLALYAIPAVNQVVIWTDPWHHLFRNNPHLDITSASFSILVESYNPWFYFFDTPYIYLIFAISLWQMAVTLRTARGAFRQQIILLLIGFALMFVIHVSYIFGLSPIPNFNVTSIPFSLTGGLLFWGMQRYRFLDVMPIARSKLIETLHDPWIVLDQSSRLVDLNPAASLLFEVRPAYILGQQAGQALARFPDLVSYLDNVTTDYLSDEIELVENRHRKWYEVRLFPLLDRQNNLMGRLLLLQDVTRRKQLETERTQAQQALRESQELFSTFMDNLPVPAFIHDILNKKLYVNEAFEQMFGPGWNGQPDPELLQLDVAKMLFPESDLPLNKGPKLSEHQITGTDGITRVVLTTNFSIRRQGKTNLVGGYVHDISELKNIQKSLEDKSSEMERLANIDSLSGLFNRRYFDQAFEREVALAEITSLPLAIGMVDIDHFKMVNDTYGHSQGDEVIREVAKRILNSIRNADIAGRVGGEEFMVLFPRTQLDEAWNVLERLRGQLESTPIIGDIKITISGGITAWRPGESAGQTRERVDKMLYQAKHSGRNRIQL